MQVTQSTVSASQGAGDLIAPHSDFTQHIDALQAAPAWQFANAGTGFIDDATRVVQYAGQIKQRREEARRQIAQMTASSEAQVTEQEIMALEALIVRWAEDLQARNAPNAGGEKPRQRGRTEKPRRGE